MLITRRHVRRSVPLLLLGILALFIHANVGVFPVGKPSWMPRYGVPGPPTSREVGRKNPLPKNLTLHFLPHSHSDIGWNLSFRGYYDRSVRRVMELAAVELWKDRARRFTWGDLAFVELWLEDKGDEANRMLPGQDGELTWRQVLHEVVDRGQWEFVGGTYVSPDEGLTSWWAHNGIVDMGHRFMMREFNRSVTIGWQVDNFGHFGILPHLLSHSGYDALILGRMAYRDLYDFSINSDLQFLWKSSSHQGAFEPKLLTHFLSVHYGFPHPSFDFDHTNECNPEKLLGLLHEFALTQVSLYPAHGHILVMMGDDFRYTKAAAAFSCMDTLIRESKLSDKHPRWRDMTLRYSTPSEYFSAIRPYVKLVDSSGSSTDHANLPLANHTANSMGSIPAEELYGPSPDYSSAFLSGSREGHNHESSNSGGLRLHTGDFYPYQDKPYEQYWSGILGSRPRLKWLVRNAEQTVHHVEALLATMRVKETAVRKQGSDSFQSNAEARWALLEEYLEYSRSQIAIGYHHDAITGTCSSEAYSDYLQRMKTARNLALAVGSYALRLASPLLVDAKDAYTETSAMRVALDEAKRSHVGVVRGRNTADQLIARRDEGSPVSGGFDGPLEIYLSECAGDSKCPGVLVMATNFQPASPQNQTVALSLHTLDVAIVDLSTMKSLTEFEIEEKKDSNTHRTIYNVRFLATGIPAMGYKSYMLTNVQVQQNSWSKVSDHATYTTTATASTIRQKHNGKDNKNKAERMLSKNGNECVLEKGSTRVRLSVSSGNSRVRIEMASKLDTQRKKRVVWHELRQYFANPKIQSSGAYIMHSFILMYSIVFYIFGGSICAGLAIAALVHRNDTLARFSVLNPIRLFDISHITNPSYASHVPLGSAAQRPQTRSDSNIDGLLLFTETGDDGNDEPGNNGKDKPLRQNQYIACAKKYAFMLVPTGIGIAIGFTFVYCVEQVFSVDRLDGWSTGKSVVFSLVLPAFLVGYVVSGSQRWNIRQCVLAIYGIALSTVVVLFFVPTWQSRPLATAGIVPALNEQIPEVRYMTFSTEAGELCDAAHVWINKNTAVTYKLCADKEPLLQVTTTLSTDVNREIVAQYELDEPSVLSEVLGGCSFDTYDGSTVIRRKYKRWIPIPGNYYPILSHVELSPRAQWSGDESKNPRQTRMALHSLQPMGAACIKPNTIETLLHRSMSGNDYRGLGEPLVDETRISVTQYLDFGLDGSNGVGKSAVRSAESSNDENSGNNDTIISTSSAVLLRNMLINSPVHVYKFLMPRDTKVSDANFQVSDIKLWPDSPQTSIRSTADRVYSNDVYLTGIRVIKTEIVGNATASSPSSLNNGNMEYDSSIRIHVLARLQALPPKKASSKGVFAFPYRSLSFTQMATNAVSLNVRESWTIDPLSSHLKEYGEHLSLALSNGVSRDHLYMMNGKHVLYYFVLDA